ncbi:hypothetical protein HII36_08795 [Nonomuraea sp. NN258]|uniref:hypothetical protein n=1 Tax=Nonomuraea antri TaxID=2730852 RepID=UPI0015680FE7|nr:hypothetical protein [Nonomuraea antri]NRQ31936.1 hypothetical protein [Nonomuraea antri]
MAAPVLIGTIPLMYVQSMSMSEGYRIERIAGGPFAQALAPSTKTITIEALLAGPERMALKKGLEALALVSRVLVAATAPLLAVAGIPVVSGLTVSLDMQITDLRFSVSAARLEALDASITLQHVPRTSVAALLGEAAELALAAGTALSASAAQPGPVPRAPGGPL